MCIDYSGRYPQEEVQKMCEAIQQAVENPPEGFQLYVFQFEDVE